jgi:hypothetical protein
MLYYKRWEVKPSKRAGTMRCQYHSNQNINLESSHPYVSPFMAMSPPYVSPFMPVSPHLWGDTLSKPKLVITWLFLDKLL